MENENIAPSQRKTHTSFLIFNLAFCLCFGGTNKTGIDTIHTIPSKRDEEQTLLAERRHSIRTIGDMAMLVVRVDHGWSQE